MHTQGEGQGVSANGRVWLHAMYVYAAAQCQSVFKAEYSLVFKAEMAKSSTSRTTQMQKKKIYSGIRK